MARKASLKVIKTLPKDMIKWVHEVDESGNSYYILSSIDRSVYYKFAECSDGFMQIAKASSPLDL